LLSPTEPATTSATTRSSLATLSTSCRSSRSPMAPAVATTSRRFRPRGFSPHAHAHVAAATSHGRLPYRVPMP
jgi:hypothetical protein